MSQIPAAACLTVLLLVAPGLAEEPAADQGFVHQLFNGQDLQGWEVRGCQAGVEEGLLVIQGGDGLVRADHRYSDFVFTWECRPRREAEWDSGIYFRCELPEGKPWPQRYQVNLRQGQEGELIGFAQTKGTTQEHIRPGDWNRFELTVIGPRAALQVNGKQAWEVEGIEAAEGYLAIQVEVPGGGQFEFRNLSLMEVGHRSLFNGRDLQGWEGAGANADSCWAVVDGLLKCTGSKGPWLRSAEEFDDFNLRLEYRLSEGGNSGVFVRVPVDGNHHGPESGIEIQLLDDAAEKYRELKPYQYTGSLYGIAPAEPRVGRGADQWNTIEIEARADNYRVIHNGTQVVNASLESFPALAERRKSGFLGLQNHQTEVYFRNIRLKRYPAASAPVNP